MKTLFTLFFAILCFGLSAQSPLRVCGHDHVLEKARTDNPNFDAEYKANLQNALNANNLHRLNDTVYQVQVVFHILYNPNDPYQNVSDELIFSQLDALNRDFNMTNADTADTRDIFKPFAESAKIEFILARQRPTGACVDGIIRKQYNPPSNFVPIFSDLLVKDDLFGGSSAVNANRFLNIWVMDLNNGRDPEEGFLGGYAYFPDMQPVRHNGVVLDFRFFGQNNPYIEEVLPAFSRYSMGRAGVHEVGHWFGLRHIWGDLGTLDPEIGCTADDGISDTPNAATAYPGLCSDTIVNSCLDQPIDYPDMFENFMDYSSDECQSMYTIEQVAAMRNALLTSRKDLIFDIEPNTTATVEATIFENESDVICFDLGKCFGYGDLEAHFVGSDSTYTSVTGSASIQAAENSNCITYNANSFSVGNEVDEFDLVVYDAQLMEYDTTRFVINIDRICGIKDTVYIDAAANSTFQECFTSEDCLANEGFFLTFCNNAFSYQTNQVVAGASSDCVNFSIEDYNPSVTQETLCVIAHYNNDDADTTVYVLDISPATGVDVQSSKDNAFDIYPNPTSGKFAIQMNGIATEDVKISIFNSTGQQMQNLEMLRGQQQLNVDISSYAKGIYIVFLETNNSITFEKITLE